MVNLITLKKVNKFYKNHYQALNNVSLNIKRGEIFALLGPNGAGKTTLINSICGLSYHSSGSIKVAGINLENNRKAVKAMIGLVPQELHLEAFDTVFSNVCYSRGLWGLKNDYDYINNLLKKLKLYEKRDSLLIQLSGGMKRRVLIAKALSHNPKILFLDEPSAGVDVELRQEMWQIIYKLKEEGVTIILTTHYLKEAEEMCDRIGILNKGSLAALDTTKNLLKRIQTKIVKFAVDKKVNINNNSLKSINILSNDINELVVSYEKNALNINEIIKFIGDQNIKLSDISTDDGDLEDVFIRLTKN